MRREPLSYWLPRSPWAFGIVGLVAGIVVAAAIVVMGRSDGGSSNSALPSPPSNVPATQPPATEPPTTEPPSTEAPTHTIYGTFTVRSLDDAADLIAHQQGYSENDGYTVRWLGARVKAMEALQAGRTFNCSTGFRGGYDDIQAGTQVTVTSEDGTLLANGQLTGGKLSIEGCKFTYTIAAVPEARFYKVEVSHRGGLTYSFDQMVSQHWKVASTLGSA